MIAAVVHDDLEINHRVAGEITACGRFDDALLNGRDEVARDRPAENFTGKLEAATSGHRLHADLAIAELPVAAALLLVPVLPVGLAANGFAVGNLGRLQGHFGVIALLW